MPVREPVADATAAGDEGERDSPPFEPTERDGALYGRGAADTKSNNLMHVGALRAWSGRPPVGIRLCIEGYEEIGSGALPGHPAGDPERFRADTLVIGDMGSMSPGVPTLTTALRGMATGNGFSAATDGPANRAARAAWTAAYGREAVLAGSGGSIPIVSALAGALPSAEADFLGRYAQAFAEGPS